MSRVYGVVTGIVKSVDDPDSQGRVQVAFPWLLGDPDSYWAPVATLMTGGGRGSWFMPEPDDEVLCSFEHGNVDQPYVVGYLWNGVQKPPSDGGASVRRIHTVSGHLLEFHDEDGGHKILIKTAGQHYIRARRHRRVDHDTDRHPRAGEAVTGSDPGDRPRWHGHDRRHHHDGQRRQRGQRHLRQRAGHRWDHRQRDRRAPT